MTQQAVNELTVLAPAKVNLFLQILGRRDDGYHLLESLFAFADFGDTITVRDAEKLSFRVEGRFSEICEIAGCAGENNLVFKAVQTLEKFAQGKGAEIILHKNLPLSAGLGGGSADAAAALKALQILWDVEIPEDTLFEIALKLGADVPACLLGKPCFVGGVGETLSPLEEFEPLEAVLINPLKPLSTPLVFKAFKTSKRPFSLPMALSGEYRLEQEKLLEETRNDLQGPAIALCPEVAQILRALGGCDGCYLPRMSGSGATCFGLFHSREHAEKAAAWLTREHPGWWVQACRLEAEPPFLMARR